MTARRTPAGLRPLAGMLLLCAASCQASDSVLAANPAGVFERLILDAIAVADRNAEKSGFFAESIAAARSIAQNSALWTGDKISVCFWNGEEAARLAVAQSAQRWNKASRIALDLYEASGKTRRCVNAETADIRVSLNGQDAALRYFPGQERQGNWSLIGRQSNFPPVGEGRGVRYDVTVNLPEVLGKLALNDLDQLDFTVGHEFGHALGLLHEFQAEVCAGWIDIDTLASDQGWAKPDAALNLAPLTDLTIRYQTVGAYDKFSIMQYNFAAKYYVQKPPEVNPCRRDKDVIAPSKGDFATLKELYGKPKGQVVAATQVLRVYGGMAGLRDKLLKRRQFALQNHPPVADALGEVQRALQRLEDLEQGRY
ncbi:hypothetical protein [Pseudoduganella violacea]|uniref:Peptidase metallopeptidase domain-containing protein n=1 Tax=Pseudoduganella violacea TaxID=1715466 RepID=A0A7W5B9X8_9BURK|nr:hypothetical protein [Pseudoduganella violacea]MBB3119264.1 hypothetical protein [Pseudoduganella violacea]